MLACKKCGKHCTNKNLTPFSLSSYFVLSVRLAQELFAFYQLIAHCYSDQEFMQNWDEWMFIESWGASDGSKSSGLDWWSEKESNVLWIFDCSKEKVRRVDGESVLTQEEASNEKTPTLNHQTIKLLWELRVWRISFGGNRLWNIPFSRLPRLRGFQNASPKAERVDPPKEMLGKGKPSLIFKVRVFICFHLNTKRALSGANWEFA